MLETIGLADHERRRLTLNGSLVDTTAAGSDHHGAVMQDEVHGPHVWSVRRLTTGHRQQPHRAVAEQPLTGFEGNLVEAIVLGFRFFEGRVLTIAIIDPSGRRRLRLE
jgi:hypothetical protein